MSKNSKERIVIVYLPTGSGHLSNAKTLKAEFVRQGYSDVILYDPISPFSKLGKFLMGTGYMLASQKIPIIWQLIYRGDESRYGCCLTHLIGLIFSLYGMIKVCKEYRPTRIVCTHAIPVYAVKYCAKKYNIPVSIVITDPFDPPRVWWGGHVYDIFCYSKEAEEWLERHGVPKRRIHAYNLLVQEKYFTQMNQNQITSFMIDEGFDPDKPLVLMVGGGDGLPKAIKIFTKLVKSNVDFQLAVICGRDINTYNILTLLSVPYAKKHIIKIYGFVSIVYELMNSAHMVIIKAGPSVIAEALVLKKPMLIASSLPGQERPNIHWVTKHQLGFYCHRPALVKKRVEELLQNPIKYARVKQRLEQYNFKNTLPAIAGDIVQITRVIS